MVFFTSHRCLPKAMIIPVAFTCLGSRWKYLTDGEIS